ncbi:MAG: hypothetical protein ACMXYA_01315 [Candidatus Woesearchaeota archaeon]
MAQNIIMQLGRDSIDDIIQVEDENGILQQQEGLVRYLPLGMIDKNFSDVFHYMTNTNGDEYNPQMNPEESHLASEYRVLADNPEHLRFHPKLNGDYNTDIAFLWNDSVRENLGQMVQPKEIIVDGQKRVYKSIDLMVKFEAGGGYE